MPLGFAARATAERWKTKLLIDNPSQAADMLFAALLDKLKNGMLPQGAVLARNGSCSSMVMFQSHMLIV